MDILEASTKLERIELLAKIAHVGDISAKEKTIVLTWIGEIAEILNVEVRSCSQIKHSPELVRRDPGVEMIINAQCICAYGKESLKS